MTSESVCRRLAVQLDADVTYDETGRALYDFLTSDMLREIADTLDHLTALQQAKDSHEV